MKLIGIVGGIGPESTIDYYRLFISTYRERRPDGGYPPVVINSIDLAKALKLVSSNDLAGLAAYMLEEIRRRHHKQHQVAQISQNVLPAGYDSLNVPGI